MKKILLISLALILTGIFYSCSEDFLEQKPIGAFGESILATKDGVHAMLVGAYSALNGAFGLNCSPDQGLFGVIHGAECFKGSDAGDQPQWLEVSQFNITTGNPDVNGFWQNYYDYIDKCNQTLKVLKQVADLSDDQKTQIEAEARFLRAHFYFYLKRTFINIPWIDENTTDFRIPNTDKNGEFVNVWPQITADMDFARKNLPEIQADLGRPNKWAADIYYAKILMYRAAENDYPNGYNEALPILTNAIANGVTSKGDKYDLLPNFHDNWDAAKENGPESVWAVQNSVNDGTPTTPSFGPSGFFMPCPNGDQKSLWIGSQSTSGPGLGFGWGFYQPTPFYADHFRTDASGLPYLDLYDTNPNRLKDDYNLPPAPAAFEIDTQGVDPRLDWTIGRRGIPFLDYGDFPGSSWIRNQDHGGPYMVKKWFVWKSQVGTYTAPGSSFTAINIHIIRFSDVLLLAAECEARVGTLANARTLVNRVRQRMVSNASSPLNWVKKADGVTNAANYRINIYPASGPKDPFQSKESALDAILFERALELGTEGHRFFDVVRFDKGEEIFNAFITAEKVRWDYLSSSVYSTIPDSYLPIPRDAIDRSRKEGVPTLTQNEGY